MKKIFTSGFFTTSIVFLFVVLILSIVIEHPSSTAWIDNGPLARVVIVGVPLFLSICLISLLWGIIKKK